MSSRPFCSFSATKKILPRFLKSVELIFLTLDLEIISSYFSELITSPSRAILNILLKQYF